MKKSELRKLIREEIQKLLEDSNSIKQKLLAFMKTLSIVKSNVSPTAAMKDLKNLSNELNTQVGKDIPSGWKFRAKYYKSAQQVGIDRGPRGNFIALKIGSDKTVETLRIQWIIERLKSINAL